MRTAIDKFLEQNPSDCQVINIGAGFDTMPFHLAERNIPNLRIFEVGELSGDDYDEGVIDFGHTSKHLFKGSIDAVEAMFQNHCPLKFEMETVQVPVRSLIEAGLVPESPTLILTECVLVCELSLPSLLSSLHRLAR
jgi:hypothetical protein